MKFIRRSLASPKKATLFIKLLPLALLLAASSAAAVTYTVSDLATLAEGTTMVIRGPNGNGIAVGGGKLVGQPIGKSP